MSCFFLITKDTRNTERCSFYFCTELHWVFFDMLCVEWRYTERCTFLGWNSDRTGPYCGALVVTDFVWRFYIEIYWAFQFLFIAQRFSEFFLMCFVLNRDTLSVALVWVGTRMEWVRIAERWLWRILFGGFILRYTERSTFYLLHRDSPSFFWCALCWIEIYWALYFYFFTLITSCAFRIN